MDDDVRETRRQLTPPETVQKALISTTSRMVGEYSSAGILITHAWPQFRSRSIAMRFTETHMSRSGYVIAFETPPIKKRAGLPVPDYSPTGEIVAAYLSVLFGKRFDSHGLLEGSGLYQIPELGSYNTSCDPKLPFNSHDARKCFAVPLEINQFSMIAGILADPNSRSMDLPRLNAACKFYMQALQNAETNIEVAYLHLITAGEILSGGFRYVDTRGVKKKFVRALCSLLDDGFHAATESSSDFGRFRPDNVERSIGAAHDLRSRYVHTGVSFGMWIDPTFTLGRNDLQVGEPVVDDKGFGEILAKAPTFLGLERILRYCILKFMASRGLLLRNGDS